VSPSRRIGKRTLAFKCCALVVTALAAVVVLSQLASDRSNASTVKIPKHFLPVSQSLILQTVSNVQWN
jgi:hypothetical protein